MDNKHSLRHSSTFRLSTHPHFIWEDLKRLSMWSLTRDQTGYKYRDLDVPLVSALHMILGILELLKVVNLRSETMDRPS